MPRGVPRNRASQLESPASAAQRALVERAVDSAVAVDSSSAEVSDPTHVVDLTPEQRIAELEVLLARVQEQLSAKAAPVPVAESEPVESGNILIHFLEDGITAFGTIWYRGQELELDPNGPLYKQTCNRFGWSWLSLRDDDFAQVERWGSVKFRSGPWPGQSLMDVAKVPFQSLKGDNNQVVGGPSEEELARAVRRELSRQRGVPTLPPI